jgi:hypothetical protein
MPLVPFAHALKEKITEEERNIDVVVKHLNML